MKKLSGCYLFLSFAAICYFAFRFDYDKSIIIGHFIFSSIIHLGFAGASYLVLPKKLQSRLFFTVYFTCYFSLWTIFYLLVFISNIEWGDTISMKMISYYYKDLPKILHSLPYSGWLYLALLLLYLVICFTGHYLLYSKTTTDVQSQFSKLVRQFQSLRLPAKLFTVASFALTSMLVGAGLFSVKRFYHMRGEPMFKFAYGSMWGAEHEQLYDPDNIALDKIDDQQRSLFKADTAMGNRKNVIVILADALRADNIDAYGYTRPTLPFIDSLLSGGKALKIDNAYATTNSTVGGLSTMFLSKIWKHVSVNGFGLVEALRMKNYKTYGILAGYQKYWYSIAATYQKHMDFLTDGTDSRSYSIDDDRTVIETLSKLPHSDNNASFFYFHLMSIHNLGFVQDQFHVYHPDQVSTFSINEKNKQRFINNYDNRILQLNSVIRSIVDSLTIKGYLKNSVIIITSDHGQSLGEGGREGHIAYLQREAIRIPAFIIDDSLSVYKNTELMRQVDLAPTILNRLQLPVPASWEGHSLLDTLKPGISFHENATWRLKRLYGFIQNDSTGTFRYLFNRDFSVQSLYKISGNNEVDLSVSNPQKMSSFKVFADSIFTSVFTP